MSPYYDHAGITIYHGDCREVLPSLVGRFDLLLTDPPYGIGAARNTRATSNTVKLLHLAKITDLRGGTTLLQILLISKQLRL